MLPLRTRPLLIFINLWLGLPHLVPAKHDARLITYGCQEYHHAVSGLECPTEDAVETLERAGFDNHLIARCKHIIKFDATILLNPRLNEGDSVVIDRKGPV